MSQKKTKKLRRLEQKARILKDRIRNLGPVLPGSVIQHHYRCGKPTCHCHRDTKARHGPYYQWTRKVKGRTVGLTLDKELADTVTGWIANDRELRRLTEKLRGISLEILKLQKKENGP